jgi:glycosyltransferase involved in cell wall biosynthesis
MRGVELREPNVVLWVGRLLPIKDPVLAIEVTAELVRRGADVRLEIVGDGSEMARAEQAASRLGIKGRVDIRGQLSWGEVMTRMDAARVLLITSLRESASAQMLEALSRGVPIVGIDQFGVGAFLPREAGIAIVPGPRSELIVELANGLDSILRLNDEEWTGVSQHARQWAENADWASKAKGLIETLCEIQGTTRL